MGQNLLPLAGWELFSTHSTQQASFKHSSQYNSQHYPQSTSAAQFLDRLSAVNSATVPPPASQSAPRESQFSMFSSTSDAQEHGYTETIADRLTRKVVRSDFDRQGRLYLRYCESPSFWSEERFDSFGRQISRTEVDRRTGRGKVLKAGPNGLPMITMIFYDKESTIDTHVLRDTWPAAV